MKNRPGKAIIVTSQQVCGAELGGGGEGEGEEGGRGGDEETHMYCTQWKFTSNSNLLKIETISQMPQTTELFRKYNS